MPPRIPIPLASFQAFFLRPTGTTIKTTLNRTSLSHFSTTHPRSNDHSNSDSDPPSGELGPPYDLPPPPARGSDSDISAALQNTLAQFAEVSANGYGNNGNGNSSNYSNGNVNGYTNNQPVYPSNNGQSYQSQQQQQQQYQQQPYQQQQYQQQQQQHPQQQYQQQSPYPSQYQPQLQSPYQPTFQSQFRAPAASSPTLGSPASTSVSPSPASSSPLTEADTEELYRSQRKFRHGEIYTPKDLSFESYRSLRKRRAPSKDAFDVLGINPLHEYKNFNLLSEYATEMGRIKHRNETGLRPVNQRKIAKAIRRAVGIGLMPSTHKHPELLKRAEEHFSTRMRFQAGGRGGFVRG